MASRQSKGSKPPGKRPKPAQLRNETVTVPSGVRSTRYADVDLEAIWITYKKTKDQNLRNILIEHHMPLVRMIARIGSLCAGVVPLLPSRVRRMGV